MKLRLHQNTLRLRLDQTDVAALVRSGAVEESLNFASGNQLIYRLESSPAAPVLSAALDVSRIVVTIPAPQANLWASSDQVSLEAADGALNILIEKDFQCLHQDASENPAAFPNPAVTPRLD